MSMKYYLIFISLILSFGGIYNEKYMESCFIMAMVLASTAAVIEALEQGINRIIDEINKPKDNETN